MIIVYHLNNSRSQRVLWLLEELALDYEICRYNRNSDMSAPDEMKRVHPLGKAPIVDVIDGGRRMTLVETGAICENLIERADGRLGAPGDGESNQRYRQFLHYAEGSIMPLLFALLVVSKIPLLGAIATRKIRPMLDLHLDYVESELSERRWFAGNTLTAADVMMSFPLEAAAKWSRLNTNRPATADWLKRIHGRDAYVRALEKGGRYDLAR